MLMAASRRTKWVAMAFGQREPERMYIVSVIRRPLTLQRRRKRQSAFPKANPAANHSATGLGFLFSLISLLSHTQKRT